MLTTTYCETKFKQIRELIKTTPKSDCSEDYVAHLIRLREAYGKEFRKALCRVEPHVGESKDRKEISLEEKLDLIRWN